MINNYIFIGFGELTLDMTYDKDYNLLKKDGGGTTWNILYHLAQMNKQCYAVGCVGNDENTAFALNTLKKVGININLVEIQNKKTNIVYSILKYDKYNNPTITFSDYSPFDGKLTFSLSKCLPNKLPNNFNNLNKIIILRDFDIQNYTFITNIKNKKIAFDLGHILFFENLDSDYIIKFLKEINICQINGLVLPKLYEKLNILNTKELFKLFNPELLIVTHGEKNAEFYYTENNKIIMIEKIVVPEKKVIDPTGAGDAFFSVILKYYKNYKDENKIIDKNFIDGVFPIANKLACKIIKQIGSRNNK